MLPDVLPASVSLGFVLVATLVAAVASVRGTRSVRVGRGRAVLASVVIAVLPSLAWLPFASRDLAREGTGFFYAFVGTVLLTVMTVQALAPRRPGWRRHAPESPVDPALAARIGELSARLGVPPPRIHVARSLGTSMQVGASVRGTASPLLVVDDGVLHRLTPTERDAVLTHELAHVAARNTWLVLTVVSLCIAVPAAILAATGESDAARVIGLAGLTAVASWRIAQRFLEIRCDVLAARVIGHEAMASALGKVHAAGRLPQEGLLGLLVHATSTHPSLETRRQALKDDAPEPSRSRIEVDGALLRRHRRVAAATLAAWLALAAAMLLLASRDAAWSAWTALVVLAAAAVAPALVLVAASWRQVRYFMLKPATWAPGSLRAIAGALVGLAALAGLETLTLDRSAQAGWGALLGMVAWALVVVAVAAIALFGWGVILTKRHQSLRQAVTSLLAEGRPHAALEAAWSSPRSLRRDPVLRYNVAFAEVVAGRREAGLAQLEKLSREGRLPGLPELLAARIFLDEAPLRALDLARKAEELMPGEPAPLQVQARAQRRLGRLEEADEVATRALEIEQGDGMLLATAAGIAVDRGDLERARRLVAAALERAPGDALTLVARAELSSMDDAPDAAAAAIAEAERAFSAHAYVLSRWELDRVRARLRPSPDYS